MRNGITHKLSNQGAFRMRQLRGDYGYTLDLVLGRYVRDAHITRLYEETSEIQCAVIGRLMAVTYL
ncbi:acyl-CoA dehydrogenase family protein [Acetobacter senegalensis]|uniref:acyl-CoA dehydrogenase family protein n=1 Tax=Acetobacter senegalensis TaxID=446692 RepID=UPI00343D808C